MAAADHILSTATSAVPFLEQLRRQTRERKLPNSLPRGVYGFEVSVASTTASVDEQNDRGLVALVPNNYPIYLLNFQVQVTDIDAGATPTFDADWIVTDLTTDVDIITASTVGQTAGRDNIDGSSAAYMMDISGKYLGWIVNTGAATPATGTVTIRGEVLVGAPIDLPIS